jgi:hypothetical protein
VVGRYLVHHSAPNKSTQWVEIEAYSPAGVNLAAAMPSSYSSPYFIAGVFLPPRANDAWITWYKGSALSSSCCGNLMTTSSGTTANGIEWWMVDLGAQVSVSAVRGINRMFSSSSQTPAGSTFDFYVNNPLDFPDEPPVWHVCIPCTSDGAVHEWTLPSP